VTLLSSLTDRLKKQSPGRVYALIAGGILLVSMLGFLLYRILQPSMVPLYSQLDSQASQSLVMELERRGVPYKMAQGGAQILVPENQMLHLRLALAEHGMPGQGSIVGYEIFDQSESLGTSHFVQNINLMRALEGELARTIGAMNLIESARVHLVMPKKELFMREEQTPSASVILGVRGSKTLSRSQIDGISHLVATAVPGLKVNHITIMDTKGHSLLLGNRGEDESLMNANKNEEMRYQYERRLRDNLEDLLSQSLGAGKVRVQVSAKMMFDRVVTNSEEFNPDGQVARSVQTEEERDLEEERDKPENVTVGNNIPNGPQGGAEGLLASRNSSQRQTETTNFEISKTVRNQISEIGQLQQLSIAVLVDGTYPHNTKGEVIYKPRSPEELSKIGVLVRSAVGFSEKRGDLLEVVNMQFITDLEALKPASFSDWLRSEFSKLAQTFIVATVIILVLLLVVRPIAIRAFEITRSEIDELNITTSPEVIMATQSAQTAQIEDDGPDLYISANRDRFKVNPIRTINDFFGRNPKDGLALLRRWLYETDD
jgi:flagellar M-ring protein FliF